MPLGTSPSSTSPLPATQGAGPSAPLSVAAIKAGPAVLVPLDADTLLGARTHDLTDPDVVDRMHDWRGQAQSVSLREHSRAATSTWKVGRAWNCGSFAICKPAE